MRLTGMSEGRRDQAGSRKGVPSNFGESNHLAGSQSCFLDEKGRILVISLDDTVDAEAMLLVDGHR